VPGTRYWIGKLGVEVLGRGFCCDFCI